MELNYKAHRVEHKINIFFYAGNIKYHKSEGNSAHAVTKMRLPCNLAKLLSRVAYITSVSRGLLIRST